MIRRLQSDRSDPVNRSASSNHWQVVVIGGGPAGCAAAIGAARAGLNTLLVEAKSFPRPKVCGGCLNSTAWRHLTELRLAAAVTAAGAVSIAETRITNGRGDVLVPLSGGSAVSRYVLDDLMLQGARDAGVTVFEETYGVLLEHVHPFDCNRDVDSQSEKQQIELRSRRFRQENPSIPGQSARLQAVSDTLGSDDFVRIVTADAVVVADGLLRSSLRNMRAFVVQTAENARIGVGTVLEPDGTGNWDRDYPRGRITMVVGSGGYVGLTQIERGCLNIAASIDASVLRTCNAATAVHNILKTASQPVPAGLALACWAGTPPLTSRIRPFAAGRVFVLGDSASYAEPFTGEGMAWGMESAAAVVPFLNECCKEPSVKLTEEWNRLQQRETKRREWMCRRLSAISRFPGMVDFSLQLAMYVPGFTRWCVSQLNRDDQRNRSALKSSADLAEK